LDLFIKVEVNQVSFSLELLLLLLTATELGERILHKCQHILFVQRRKDILINAKSLELLDLEEVCQPEDVLNDVERDFPLDGARVDKVKYNSKRRSCGPKR